MKKDFAVIKALTAAGIRPEEELSAEQEEMLRRALDPDVFFLDDVEHLFKPKTVSNINTSNDNEG